MPKIEVADLITDLQRQRDEIDATIRVLSRTLSRSNAPDTKAKSKSLRTRSAGEQGEAMGAAESRRPKRPLSPASRKKLSEAAKKRWAIAKSAAKS